MDSVDINYSELLSEIFPNGAPHVFRNIFSAPPINSDDLLQIISRFCNSQKGEISPSLRVFQDGRREDLEYKLVESVTDSFDSFEDWFHDTFGWDGTAVFLNHIEQWSVPVADFSAALACGLTDDREEFDVEAVLLIGDYGYTPFGAHLDEKGTQIFHVPISQNKKTMNFWTEEEFLRVTNGKKRFYQPETIIDSATKISYQANDLFYLPPNYFHVGFSPILSATLVITLTSHDKLDRHSVSSSALAAHFGSNWNRSELANELTLTKLLEISSRHNSLLRDSNCGLKSIVSNKVTPIEIDAVKQYAIARPFKIHYNYFGALLLYIRGKSIRLSAKLGSGHLTEICGLFEMFNAGHSLSINLASILAPSLREDAIERVFELLAQHHILVQKDII